MGSDGGSGDDGKSPASGEVATGMSSKSPASGSVATGIASDDGMSPASRSVAMGMASDDAMSPAPGAVATGKSSKSLASGAVATGKSSKSLASGAVATGGMGSDDGKSPAPGAVAALTIRWATGGKFTVLADLGSTVVLFKEIVAKYCYVPAPRQCLIYKGRILKDEQTLKSYGVETDHTIHLVRELGDSPQLITPSHTGGIRGDRSTGGATSLGSFWGHVQHFVRQNPILRNEIENMPMLLKVINSPEIQRNIATLTALISPYCPEEATTTAAVNNISTRERMDQRGLGVAHIKSFLHDLFGPSKGNAVGGFSLADYGLLPGGTPDGSLLSQLLSPAAIKIFYDTFADPELLYKFIQEEAFYPELEPSESTQVMLSLQPTLSSQLSSGQRSQDGSVRSNGSGSGSGPSESSRPACSPHFFSQRRRRR